MYTPRFCLLIFISFTTDLLFAYPLRDEKLVTTSTVGDPKATTSDQDGRDKAPPSRTWSTAEIYGVTLGLVPGLWLVISLGAFCYYWYHTSYRAVLADWKKRNIAGHPQTDIRVVFGKDGRANWTDCYGPFDAQNAVDMINTVMLCQHRNPDPLLGQMPIFAIKGKELKSVENAFNELPISDRPSFTYERQETPKPDKRQAAFEKRKSKIQNKKDKRNIKKAKLANQRAKLLQANRTKLEVAKAKTATKMAAQKKKADQDNKERCTVVDTATSTTEVEVCPVPELSNPEPIEVKSSPPASIDPNHVAIDIEPQATTTEQAESSAPDNTPPGGEFVPTPAESRPRYY